MSSSSSKFYSGQGLEGLQSKNVLTDFGMPRIGGHAISLCHGEVGQVLAGAKPSPFTFIDVQLPHNPADYRLYPVVGSNHDRDRSNKVGVGSPPIAHPSPASHFLDVVPNITWRVEIASWNFKGYASIEALLHPCFKV